MKFEKKLKLELQSVVKPKIVVAQTQEKRMTALHTERTEDNKKCKVYVETQVEQRVTIEQIEYLTVKKIYDNQSWQLKMAEDTSIMMIRKITTMRIYDKW